MTQNAASHLKGQIEAPTRVEMFWEENKKFVLLVVALAAAGLGVNYLIQYMDRQARDERWSQFAVATGLDRGYTEPGAMASLVEQNPQYLPYYISGARAELVAKLNEADLSAQPAILAKLAAGDDGQAPLALWLMAEFAVDDGKWDEAEAHLSDLEKRFPNHFLNLGSAYPVQWRKEIKEEEEADGSKPRRPNLEPKYEPAVAGSEVELMRQRIAAQREFRATNESFFVAPEPTSAETIVFEIANAGTIKIKLFDQLAPNHAAKLLELASAGDGGWWAGQHVYLIEREGSQNMFQSVSPSEMHFGWKSTETTDRTKWLAGEVESDHVLDWERVGVSHFPGMVAVEPHTEGKSQVERLVFNFGDVAGLRDGTRVVVGKVVEGLDVVQKIVESDFEADEAIEAGSGRPGDNFAIVSVKVEK